MLQEHTVLGCNMINVTQNKYIMVDVRAILEMGYRLYIQHDYCPINAEIGGRKHRAISRADTGHMTKKQIPARRLAIETDCASAFAVDSVKISPRVV